MRHLIVLSSFLCILTLGGGRPYADEKRETIFDRVVHLEEEVVREIPRVPRLCDEIGISGKLEDIGGVGLFREREGKGLPIVLINGGPGGTHAGFHPHFSRAAKFSEVVYYDQRGCGRSDYEAGDGYSVAQAVDDLERLRGALGIKRWVVLGWSYGGFLAQNYAVAHPDNLAGLVLVGSSPAMRIQTGGSRQQQFISPEEKRRIGEILRTPGLSTAQVVYNIHLNGDWKRQGYYRPTREAIARSALYGWVHDPAFRSAIGRDKRRIDLEDLFEEFPIPTLILEGKWDLTWGAEKAGALRAKHRNAKLVMFEKSAHSPFGDEPEKFFDILEDFVRKLPKTPARRLAKWKAAVAAWKKDKKDSPEGIIQGSGWGHASNQKLVKGYSEAWLGRIRKPRLLMKLGFALYDIKRYKEALAAFEGMEEKAGNDRMSKAIAFVWQGQMLDLMGKRKEAVRRYRKAVPLGATSTIQHDQFGLAYAPSKYAEERIQSPFRRVENRNKD